MDRENYSQRNCQKYYRYLTFPILQHFLSCSIIVTLRKRKKNLQFHSTTATERNSRKFLQPQNRPFFTTLVPPTRVTHERKEGRTETSAKHRSKIHQLLAAVNNAPGVVCFRGERSQGRKRRRRRGSSLDWWIGCRGGGRRGSKTDRPGSAYRLFDSIKNDCPIRRGLLVRPFIGHGLFSLLLSRKKKKRRRNSSKIELHPRMVLTVSWRGWLLSKGGLLMDPVGTRVSLGFSGRFIDQ